MSDLQTTFDPVEKIWSGPKKTLLFNPEASVGQVIYTCLSRQDPANIVQINDGENTTLKSGQVLEMSIKIGQKIHMMGLKQTDIVGIMSSNTTNLMPLCYGLFFIGVPFHAIDRELSKTSAVLLWGITKPKIIFCEVERLSFAREIVQEIGLRSKIYVLNQKSFYELFEELPGDFKFSPHEIQNSDQMAAISNSSGSTGLPKAVTISHKMILETLSSL